MKTLLVTAFSPFGGDETNSSLEVLDALPEFSGAAEIKKLCLPVVFGEAAELALAEARRVSADAILCLGQAAGRSAVTPERVAVNLMDASIPDNAGFRPVDEPIVAGGPAAYFSTLPVKAMAAAIAAAGVPSLVSLSAGSYVCNSLMYALLQRALVPCGFVHIPRLGGVFTREAVAKAIAAAAAVIFEG